MYTDTIEGKPKVQPMEGRSQYDPKALHNIRALMEDAQERPSRRRQAGPVRKVPVETHEETLSGGAHHSRLPFAELAPPQRKEKSSNPRIARTMPKIFSYRPTPKHVVWGVLALVLLFRPWLVFWAVLLSVFIVMGMFLVLGYDGFWQTVMKAGRWYGKRRPHRAAALQAKMDGFAVKWDRVLDHFPDGTVDGLYMPDFGQLATAETRYDAALDRRFADMSKS